MSKTGTDQLQSQLKNDIFMNLDAVSIDVSKCKNTVVILRPGGTVVANPFDVFYLSVDFQFLKNLSGNWMMRFALSRSVPVVTMNR